jgi:hypothetical protein
VALTAFRERRTRLRFASPPFAERIGRGLLPQILDPWAVAIYLILPSLAFSLVNRAIRVVPDPLLLLFVEALIPNWSRRVLRLVWVVACGCVVLMEWNIYPDSYLFYASMLTRILFTPHGSAILGAIVFTLGFLALPTRLVKPNKVLPAVLLVLYVLIVLAKGPIWMEQKYPWLRAPLGRAVQAAIFERDRFWWSVTGGKDADKFQVSHQLHDVLTATPDAALPSKVMVFTMESWGERGDDLEVVRRKLMTLPGVASAASGYDMYHGSTLPGELRELCGARLDFKQPKAVSGNCLPKRFRALGYRTTSFHGYDGIFYSRDVVYPALGFQSSLFKKDIKTAAECGGAFPGRCDDETAAQVLAQASQPGRQFAYMMSLSAHAIVDPATLKRTYVVNNHLPIKGSDDQVLNRAMILQVVREAAANPALRGGLLYFAGDHNPPVEVAPPGLPEGKVPFLLIRLQP